MDCFTHNLSQERCPSPMRLLLTSSGGGLLLQCAAHLEGSTLYHHRANVNTVHPPGTVNCQNLLTRASVLTDKPGREHTWRGALKGAEGAKLG